MKILISLILFCISFNSFTQKLDVSLEINNLKENVKELQIENNKLSTDLSASINKYENRILDLGSKIEDLRFEINVLKRIIEQFRNGEISSNSKEILNSTHSEKSSSIEENSAEKTESKPSKQSNSQCSATTKKGVRCSRTARSNGFCWQHGG